jgi:prenyltransferase beta subunit
MADSFKKRILECVDRGLDCFGDSVKHVIYWNLEQTKKLNRKDISDKPEEFCRALASFFGTKGLNVVERNIVNQIKVTFGLSLQNSYSLSDAVREARKCNRRF